MNLWQDMMGLLGASGVFSAAKAGTFTPSADITTSLTITHNLGVAPDVFFLWAVNAATNNVATYGGIMFCTYSIASLTGDANNCGNVFYMGQSSTGSSSTRSNDTGIPTRPTATTATIQPVATAKLKAGVTYVWIAAKLA